MDRRRFLLTSLAGALVTPLAAEAQPAGRVYRIGLLWNTPNPQQDAVIQQGLRERGWVEGQNIVFERRYSTGQATRPSAHGLLTTVAWRRGGATTYALDGGVLAAGSVIGWLCERLGLARDEAALDALARSAPAPCSWPPAAANARAPPDSSPARGRTACSPPARSSNW